MLKNDYTRLLLLELLLADLSLPVETYSGHEWQFHIFTVRESSYWQIYSPQYRHLVVKNGNFTFLLLELILADLLPQVQASSGQEWPFHISTVRAHIGRSTGRSVTPSRGI